MPLIFVQYFCKWGSVTHYGTQTNDWGTIYTGSKNCLFFPYPTPSFHLLFHDTASGSVCILGFQESCKALLFSSIPQHWSNEHHYTKVERGSGSLYAFNWKRNYKTFLAGWWSSPHSQIQWYPRYNWPVSHSTEKWLDRLIRKCVIRNNVIWTTILNE